MDFIALDLETVGLMTNSNGGHITQIALSKYNSTNKTVEVILDKLIHSSYVQVPPHIEALTGISTKMIRESPYELDAVMDELLAAISNIPVVIHNAAFDTLQLNDVLIVKDLSVIQDYTKIYCSLQYFRKNGLAQSNKLSDLVSHYGLDCGGFHNAASDTYALCKLIEHIDPQVFFTPQNLYFL